MPERHFILGAARSGKTSYAISVAKSLAAAQCREVAYVATAQALDAEMTHRIAVHRAERPPSWATLEAPDHLADALDRQGTETILVVDCMTLWLSNALTRDFRDEAATAPLPAWATERAAMLRWLTDFRGDVLLVSNEVGAGIVPVSALARRFQDEQGRLNQSLAVVCDRVTLVVAGIAVPIKKCIAVGG